VLIEPIGHLWVAFSPASGETTLLNDSSASILEVLELGASSTDAISSTLACDSGLEARVLEGIVEASWPSLIEAGLVDEQRSGEAIPQ
jgi:PqqD family protein of HPr-rel-A system